MDTENNQGIGRQTRLALAVFACIAAVLAAAYFFLLRADYVVLYTELRAADASAVVTELDRQGISYELRDGGATILVPDSEAANVRLAIAGSDLPLNGLVGFELFNESDLGLTDFTQKINYQRALQGEIARTIMMMDGIENARVHLVVPERSLFRGVRTESRAAVTVVARRGRLLDEARVAGIQRLVAASVPDLDLANVVVLDGVGRVISASASPEQSESPGSEEQAALESLYRARIRSAVEPLIRGRRFEVRVTAVAREPAPPVSGAEPRAQYRLRIVMVSPDPIGTDEQALVANAVRTAADVDEQAGDSLAFAQAPIGIAAAPALPLAARPDDSRLGPAPIPAQERGTPWPAAWALVAALLAAVAAILLIRRRRREPGYDHVAFAARLRTQLAIQESGGG